MLVLPHNMVFTQGLRDGGAGRPRSTGDIDFWLRATPLLNIELDAAGR